MTALNENQRVAEEYIQLQSKHMDRKNQFLSSYEKSLNAQDKLNDKENVRNFFIKFTLLYEYKYVVLENYEFFRTFIVFAFFSKKIFLFLFYSFVNYMLAYTKH